MADKAEVNSDINNSNECRGVSRPTSTTTIDSSDKTETDSPVKVEAVIAEAEVNLEERDDKGPTSSSDEIRHKSYEESKSDEGDLVLTSSSPSPTKAKESIRTENQGQGDEINESKSIPRNQGPPDKQNDGGDTNASNNGSSNYRPKESPKSGASNKAQEDEDKFKHEKERFENMKIDEKRKLYKCGTKFKTLEQIKTWPAYYAENQCYLERKVKVKKDKHFPVNNDLNNKISVVRDDITTLEIDAIVNAANESLLGGGGVDGAIHKAAGKYLVKECASLNGCKTGQAKITGGYMLPAKYVIHTVGPRGEHPDLLQKCYFNSLNCMKENNLRSIAFPCISTGIFGYPNLAAANVALETIRSWLEKDDNSKNVDRIILCLFLQKDVDIYDHRLQVYFPIHESPDVETKKTTEGTEQFPTALQSQCFFFVILPACVLLLGLFVYFNLLQNEAVDLK